MKSLSSDNEATCLFPSSITRRKKLRGAGMADDRRFSVWGIEHQSRARGGFWCSGALPRPRVVSVHVAAFQFSWSKTADSATSSLQCCRGRSVPHGVWNYDGTRRV